MAGARPSDAEIEQRRGDVLQQVIEQGEVRIGELTERFGVSLMTMHRDLDDLADRRLLVKGRGKVTAYPALTMETAKRFRATLHRRHKDALALRAVREVSPGQTVFVDDSTTLTALVHALARMSGLVVITNSVETAHIVRSQDDSRNEVILLGGRYTEFESCVGPDTIAALARTHVDVGFVSATAVDDGQLYHPLQDYAELKAASLQVSTRNILVADHSKFGRTATYRHGDVGAYDLLVADSETPAAQVDAARRLGVAVDLIDVAG